jgi:hypothetical protein
MVPLAIDRDVAGADRLAEPDRVVAARLSDRVLAIAALERNISVLSEVTAAVSLAECRRLVRLMKGEPMLTAALL